MTGREAGGGRREAKGNTSRLPPLAFHLPSGGVTVPHVAAGSEARSGTACALALAVLLMCVLGGCAARATRTMEVTAYCGCSECAEWERGSWKYLKLDFWHRYVSKGPRKGEVYTGETASGSKPHEPRPGLVSIDSLTHPWMIPIRLVFPWLWFPRDGTVAADTRYYRFGTKMYVPGYGPGVVEDRGGAIKGPDRIDVFFDSHSDALEWGRRHVAVEIER